MVENDVEVAVHVRHPVDDLGHAGRDGPDVLHDVDVADPLGRGVVGVVFVVAIWGAEHRHFESSDGVKVSGRGLVGISMRLQIPLVMTPLCMRNQVCVVGLCYQVSVLSTLEFYNIIQYRSAILPET